MKKKRVTQHLKTDTRQYRLGQYGIYLHCIRMELNCNDFKMQIVLASFVILAVSCLPTNASVGGHDLFTSLAQLEVLWKNEMKVVDLMENAIKKMESASNALKEYGH